MKSAFSVRGLVGLVVAGAVLLPGCGTSVKTVPVSGKVTLDNQPLTGGQVTLVPTTTPEKADAAAVFMVGTIDSSGTYKISTGGKDGAPVGKYKVTVNPPMMPMSPDAKGPSLDFDKQYTDAKTTPLEITVSDSPAAGAYDLKLTK
jgi:hypothetical protein